MRSGSTLLDARRSSAAHALPFRFVECFLNEATAVFGLETHRAASRSETRACAREEKRLHLDL
jgi:hypothetical protein